MWVNRRNTQSRTEGGKWLLYSKAKLVKPYDYVVRTVSGSDKDERGSQPVHSSGPDTSQYTFANVGVQASAASIDSRKAGEGANHHGWQPALMTGFMWMANVTGEFLYRMDERVQTSPVGSFAALDDPIAMLEQALVDLKLAYDTKDVLSALKQLVLLLYYAVQMATNMQLHPFCPQRFSGSMWQLSKIYDDFAPAESAYQMIQNAAMKEVRDGYAIATDKSRVLGAFSLEDKADIVFTIPIEVS